MDQDTIIKIVIGALIGFALCYLLFGGQAYSDLNTKYQALNQKYIQLNQSYISLQQNYTELKQECGQALQKLDACVGRENFFEWVNRLSTLGGMAKFLGLI